MPACGSGFDALFRGERGLLRTPVPGRGAPATRYHAVRRHVARYSTDACRYRRRPPMDGQHVRRYAGLSDQRRLSGAVGQEYGRLHCPNHRHAGRLPLFCHDGHVGDAPVVRRRPMGGHRRGLGLRIVDLFPADYRRRPCYQDVGIGLRSVDDGRRLDDLARKHVVRRCLDGTRGLARNRSQPSADHLLFPDGDGRLLDE